MAKLKQTYPNRPYFHPAVGDLLAADQVSAMVADDSWRAFSLRNGDLAIDFAELDGSRADWFDHLFPDRVDYYRCRCIHTFANGGAFWLVVATSY